MMQRFSVTPCLQTPTPRYDQTIAYKQLENSMPCNLNDALEFVKRMANIADYRRERKEEGLPVYVGPCAVFDAEYTAGMSEIMRCMVLFKSRGQWPTVASLDGGVDDIKWGELLVCPRVLLS
jgi:hypothetical protein